MNYNGSNIPSSLSTQWKGIYMKIWIITVIWFIQKKKTFPGEFYVLRIMKKYDAILSSMAME